jgi:hypothetical protein
LAVLRNSSKWLTDSEKEQPEDKVFKGLLRAILGFFANLICFPSIRMVLRKDNHGANFLTNLLPQYLKVIGDECSTDPVTEVDAVGPSMNSQNEGGKPTPLDFNQPKPNSLVHKNMDIIHRIVFIGDEYLREEELNIFDQKTSVECLELFFNSAPNMELKALCGQFIEIDEAK